MMKIILGENTEMFEITILSQHWILDNGEYDANDLCSHGKVYIRVGSEVLNDGKGDSFTLSTAALLLKRSLQKNCDFEEFDNLMVPCCGHDMYLNPDDPASVLVPGCRGGVDCLVRETRLLDCDAMHCNKIQKLCDTTALRHLAITRDPRYGGQNKST